VRTRKNIASNLGHEDSGYLWRVSVRRWPSALALAALFVATLGGGCMFELGEVKDPVEGAPCPEGFGSCEGGPACGTNLLTSADHCGACGRSCLGGACTNGLCPVQTLTSAGTRPYGIAIDDTFVYYADRDEGILRKVPKEGGATTTMASNQSRISFVAADPGAGGFVYFTRNSPDGGISKVPKSGGAAVTLASTPWAWEIAIDESYVYFTTGGPENPPMTATGTLQRVAKTGGAATRLATTSVEPGSIALDDTSIYFTDKGAQTVSRLNRLSPSAVEQISESQAGPDDIAIEGENLFWTCYGADLVVKRPKNATSATMNVALVLGEGNPNGIAVGGNFVYYSTYRGNTLARVSADGGPSLLLAEVDTPIRLVLDDQYVYFTGNGEETGGPDGVFRVSR